MKNESLICHSAIDEHFRFRISLQNFMERTFIHERKDNKAVEREDKKAVEREDNKAVEREVEYALLSLICVASALKQERCQIHI